MTDDRIVTCSLCGRAHQRPGVMQRGTAFQLYGAWRCRDSQTCAKRRIEGRAMAKPKRPTVRTMSGETGEVECAALSQKANVVMMPSDDEETAP